MPARRAGTRTGARARRTGLALGLAALAGCATRPQLGGPMTPRNQHPAQLTVLHMDPTGATPLRRGEPSLRVDAAYTSLFLGGSGLGNSFEMDGEILRTGIKAAVGLGDGLELAAELPLAHTTGGFLDDFLIDWHSFWGLPDQGRSAAPRRRFRVRARQQGAVVYEMTESDLRLLDIPVELRWAFLPVTDAQPLGVAVRAAIEWPTGDDKRGYGNGEIDYAVGVVGELRQPHFAVTAHLQHTFAGSPDSATRSGFEFGDVTSAGLALEWAFADHHALLVQTEFETSTLRGLGFSRVEDPQWLLWFGTRSRIGDRVAVEVALGEDLSSFIAPDFTAYVGIAFDLGRRDP